MVCSSSSILALQCTSDTFLFFFFKSQHSNIWQSGLNNWCRPYGIQQSHQQISLTFKKSNLPVIGSELFCKCYFNLRNLYGTSLCRGRSGVGSFSDSKAQIFSHNSTTLAGVPPPLWIHSIHIILGKYIKGTDHDFFSSRTPINHF